VKWVFQFPTTLPCFWEDSYILPWKPFLFLHFVYIFLKNVYINILISFLRRHGVQFTCWYRSILWCSCCLMI
jgi:hypothetical protein